MRTKHLFISLIALLAVLISSCTEEQTVTGTGVNGVQTFTFNLTTDGQTSTRAAAPAVTGYKLKYFLQVLDASGNAITAATKDNETGTFNVELPVGAAYTCLFWAHYIPDAGGTPNEYFTVTDLKAVTLQKHLTGDDQCQAFCANAAIAADAVAGSHSVILKRAVAQVNVKSSTKMENYSKLTASYTNVPNTFNVADNTVTATGSVTTPSAFETTDFTAGAGGDGKFTYQSAYFLASADGTNSMLNIEIKTYNSTVPSTPLQTMTIANVPTKKNFKTNVVTDFNPANATHTYTFDFEDWGTDVVVTPPSIWDGVVPAGNPSGNAFSGGTGADADNAYLLSSALDLAQLAADVNAGCDYANKYFELTVDIDLNNHEWTPAGTYIAYNDAGNKVFKGTLDGKHHKVMQLTVNSSAEKGSIGLFGYVEDGSIQNLHVSGNVSSTHATGNNSAGGIVGVLNAGKVKACSFDGSVSNSSSNGNAAGICGNTNNMATSIFGCINRGAITSGYDAGGITNWCQSFCMACYNEGTITAANKAAGIVSTLSDATGSIVGCYNIGTIGGAASTKEAIAYNEGGGASVKECYSIIRMTESHGGSEIQFSESTWPDGVKVDDGTSDNLWRVDAAPDGTYEFGNATSWKYQNCKIWKSVGGWNSTESLRVYPKLWWEE